MTTEKDPADAVREALDLIDSLIDDYGSIRHADALETIRDRIAALTARVAELEAENGRLFGDLDLNWVSHQAMVKANKRAEQAEARLAALAGASPVAWRIRLSERGNNPWGPGPWNYEASKPSPSPADFYEVEPLFTHAPAKAREDDARAMEMERQRDDYLNREWVAVKAQKAAEREAAIYKGIVERVASTREGCVELAKCVNREMEVIDQHISAAILHCEAAALATFAEGDS